jgi:hypothetical protein
VCFFLKKQSTMRGAVDRSRDKPRAVAAGCGRDPLRPGRSPQPQPPPGHSLSHTHTSPHALHALTQTHRHTASPQSTRPVPLRLSLALASHFPPRKTLVASLPAQNPTPRRRPAPRRRGRLWRLHGRTNRRLS